MGSGGIIIVWILVFFGIFYFLAIRPQRRQRQAHSDMVRMLKRGDEVVTIGGMFGTVTRIGDDWVELEIAKRTRVRYLKRAISQITSVEEEEEEEDEYIEAEADEDEEQAQLTEGDEEEVYDEADEAEVEDETAPEEPEAPEPPKA
jgi:preprotein translocase subunit YajC